MKTKALGCMLWPLTIGLGIFGWIKWKWYALPLTLFLAWILGNVYSFYLAHRVKKLTGMSTNAQIVAYYESLATRNNTPAQGNKAYWEYDEPSKDEEDTECVWGEEA